MSNQPSHYKLAHVKDLSIRTIRALDQQTTVDDLLEVIDNGLCTEAEAWHLVSGQQLWQILARNTEQYGLYGWV